MVRRNRIIVLIFSFCLLGCKQEKKEIVETEKTNNILNEEKMSNNMDEYEAILNSNGFKYPSEEIFNSKIKQFFGINLKENQNDEVEIIPKNTVLDETNFYPKAIIKKRYIFWMQDDEGRWDDMAFVNLNKYIFYDDKAAFTYLKIKDANSYLSSLVYYFGYDKDEDLLKYMFYNSKGSLSLYSNVFFGRNGVNGLFELRKGLFNKYLEYNPNADILVTFFIPCLIDKTNENYILNYEGNRDADAGFILEKILYQMEQKGETLISGSVDYIFGKYPKFLNTLTDKNAFNFPLLKYYIENFLDVKIYEINDPDGYTNLRKEKNTTSSILEKVETGESIDVINNTGDWYLVKTKAGNQGYIHKSRIKSE